MRFTEALEVVFVSNFTFAHKGAYGGQLTSRLYKVARESKNVRRAFVEFVQPCLVLDMRDHAVPEKFYTLVFDKYSYLRSKDIARSVSRAHAAGEGAISGGT
jgi:hypothetical protein